MRKVRKYIRNDSARFIEAKVKEIEKYHAKNAESKLKDVKNKFTIINAKRKS